MADFCLLFSGWGGLGRLVALPVERLTFMAVRAFVLVPAVSPRSAGPSVWKERQYPSGIDLPCGVWRPPWGVCLDPELVGPPFRPRKDWLLPRGLRSFWCWYCSNRLLPSGCPGDGAIFHFNSKLSVL